MVAIGYPLKLIGFFSLLFLISISFSWLMFEKKSSFSHSEKASVISYLVNITLGSGVSVHLCPYLNAGLHVLRVCVR